MIEYIAPQASIAWEWVIGPLVFVFMVSAFASMAFLEMAMAHEKKGVGKKKLLIPTVLLAVAFVSALGVTVSAMVARNEYYAGLAAMKRQAAELYPSVSAEQLDSLFGYKADRPDGDFKVVGTVFFEPEGNADSYTHRSLSLVWTGKGYIIAESVDGRLYKPLSLR